MSLKINNLNNGAILKIRKNNPKKIEGCYIKEVFDKAVLPVQISSISYSACVEQ